MLDDGSVSALNAAEIERRACELAVGRFEFMGLSPSDLIDAIHFARARGWTAPSERLRASDDA